MQRECQKALIIYHSTQMDYTTLAPSSPPACSSTIERDKQHTTSGNEEATPPQPQVKASSSSMLQRHQRAKAFSEQATNILSAAWRKNTKSKYEWAIKRYISFCHEREADPYNSNDTIVIEFLTQESNPSSAINGMITAIKKTNSQASTELIRTFKKRAFNLRPPVTKYHKIWDPDVLLSYLESMDTEKSRHLSMKTASLIKLLSGHRVNTLENIKITDMYISKTECTFVFSSVLKHSRPGCHQQPLI